MVKTVWDHYVAKHPYSRVLVSQIHTVSQFLLDECLSHGETRILKMNPFK